MPIGGQGRKPRSSAGHRDRYVLIEQVDDPDAQFPLWIPLGFEWMSRDDTAADEHFSSDQVSAWGEAEWQMAYRAEMDPELLDVPKLRRLIYEGRTYEIRKAAPLAWKRDIALFTLARVG